MTNTTARRFDLTPTMEATSRGADPKFRRATASEGAVRQDGTLNVFHCSCGAEVVWATSRTSGRKFLASVWKGESGARFYVKGSVHTWASHDERVARSAAEAERLAAGEGMVAAIETLQDLKRQYRKTVDVMEDAGPYSSSIATDLVGWIWTYTDLVPELVETFG